jgi:pimeloyl-ACP methyl ester carboxylesterase
MGGHQIAKRWEMSKLRSFVTSFSTVAVLCIGMGSSSVARADHETARDDDGHVNMDRVFFPVTLSDGKVHLIAGYLFFEGSAESRILQVAVHGATHWSLYWDIPPFNGISYSYAKYMAHRGYSVLAIDQLGTGASAQPDGDTVTLPETANALHQVLASLRSPNNPTHQRFRSIALVGHSNGSLTSVFATGTYHDADALVTTAWMHPPHPLPFNPGDILALLTTPYLPANTFSEAFLTATFYYVPSTEQALLDFEANHLVAIQARAQFIDLFQYGLNSNLTRSTSVTVPVLVQNGDFDALQPAAFMGPEPTYYPNAPSVTLQTLDAMGHNINGHRNHLQSWQGIDQWIRQKLH